MTTPVIAYSVESLFDDMETGESIFCFSNSNISENSKPNWENAHMSRVQERADKVKN